MTKGRIAETLIQQLFLNIFRYGMGNTIPTIMELLKGVKNDGRELRYLIELSIKGCCDCCQFSKTNTEDKIEEYEKLLNSSNINPINSITFRYFDDPKKKFYYLRKKAIRYLS